jgi:tetratricopeptide (TPR) repeat protein
LDPVHDIFQRALDLPAAGRSDFVREACGADRALCAEVMGLLSALDAADGFLSDSPALPAETAGVEIGRYRLLEEIGEGGFGVVWMAEQTEPVRRRVALKVLKPGMDTRQVFARFEAERQALALMDHPHIAKVLDGGTTPNGRPYFVMELVHGLPITEFCDRAEIPIRDRLELFVQVCRAVEHAHQKGVVHRDLKPGNVLVTLLDDRPVPKVIDFGVAKAIGSEELTQGTLFTGFRQVLGTPEYMAPEQTGLSGQDVDTRADVYALGVLLYELLTGARPFALADVAREGVQELLRRIREVEPVKPSTRIGTLGARLPVVARTRATPESRLRRLLRGDLDWIVVRALEKERERRYPTASELGMDVQRHLDGLPVEAGPPSAVYRISRLAHRHRAALFAAGLVLFSLVVGVIATAIGLTRAVAAEAEARAEAGRSQAALQMLQRLLAASNPHSLRGPDTRVRDLLDEIGRDLERRPVEDPEVEATVRSVVGGAFRALGLLDAAEPHLVRAVELRRAQPRGDGSPLAEVLWQWAWLLHDRGAHPDAEAAMRESLELVVAAGGADTAAAAERQYALADLLRHQGRLDEAEARARAAIERLGRDPRDRLQLAMATNELGLVAMDRRQPAVAEPLFRAALADFVAVEGELGPTTAMCEQNLGTALLLLRRDEEARAMFAAAVRARTAALGEDHVALAAPLDGLASAEIRLGRDDRAEPLLRRTLALRERGGQMAAAARSAEFLADLLQRGGRTEEAVEPATAAVRFREQAEGPESLAVAGALARLGALQVGLGRPAEAEAVLRRSLAIRSSLAPDHWLRWNSASLLGACLDALGRDEEAEPLLRSGFENMRPPAAWQVRRDQARARLVAFHERRAGDSPMHAARAAALRAVGGEGAEDR